MISFDCQCGKPFRFSLKFKGRPFRCNVCGRSLVVPEESVAKTGGKPHTSVKTVDSSDIITPVKPVLAIDLASLPKNLRGAAAPPVAVDDFDDDTPISGISYRREDETVSDFDDDDDGVVFTGNVSKTDNDDFHVDLSLERQDQSKPKPPVVVVKSDVAQSVPETSEPETQQAPKKKSGWFSSRKKETKDGEEPVKQPQKPEKKAKTKPAKEKAVKVQQPASESGVQQSKKTRNVMNLMTIVVSLLLVVVFAGLWMLERGNSKTERDKAVKFENQANEFRQKYNALMQEQESAKQPVSQDEPGLPIDIAPISPADERSAE